jgi:hypothetical protein
MVALFAVSVVVVFVPGLVVGAAGGLRGWLLVGTAPLLTLGATGVFAPLLPALPAVDVRWSPPAFAVAFLGLAAVILAVRLLVSRVVGAGSGAAPADPASPWALRHHLGVAGAVAVAAAVGLLAMERASRAFTAVPQWHDATHHGNAIRFISDTGNSAPTALKILVDPSAPDSFYPNAYYVLCATVRQVGGFGVVPTLNVVNGMLVGLFSLALVVLVKECTGRAALCAATALLACTVTMFPYDLLVWGPLFPFSTGLVMVPAFVALFHSVLATRAAAQTVLVALGAVGLVAVHTGVTATAVVLAAAYLAQRWVTDRRVIAVDLALLLGIAVAAVAVGIFQIVGVLRSTAVGATIGIDWPVESPAGDALGRLVTSSRSIMLPQWWLTLLLVVGLIYLGRRKFTPLYFLLLGGAAIAVLYVLDASNSALVVNRLAAPWSDDPFRLAAAATPAMIVLAAIGMVGLRDGLVHVLVRVGGRAGGENPEPKPHRLRRTGPAVALGLVLLTFAYVTEGLYLDRNTSQLAKVFPDGPIVSTETLRAMAWVAERIPPGTTLANDPLDGSPWIWAIDGVQPLFGSSSAGRPDDGSDRAVVLQRLNQLDTDPRVQEAVRNLRISYVFVSQGWVVPGKTTARGLQGLDDVAALHAVYRAPTVQIYQVRDVPALP